MFVNATSKSIINDQGSTSSIIYHPTNILNSMLSIKSFELFITEICCTAFNEVGHRIFISQRISEIFLSFSFVGVHWLSITFFS